MYPLFPDTLYMCVRVRVTSQDVTRARSKSAKGMSLFTKPLLKQRQYNSLTLIMYN